jgi:transcriptional regulator with XRE-family HTH domain
MGTYDDREQPEAKRFGSRLTELRESRGWTQVELSRRSGIASSRLSRIERGLRLPRFLELLGLREALALGLEELVFEEAAADTVLRELAHRLAPLLAQDEAAGLTKILRLLLRGIEGDRVAGASRP